MNWASSADFWAAFFHMGGYGLYVWGSYGVTAALIAAEIVTLRMRKRSAMAALRGAGDNR